MLPPPLWVVQVIYLIVLSMGRRNAHCDLRKLLYLQLSLIQLKNNLSKKETLYLPFLYIFF
jgi:hypothetical protein